MTDSAEMRELRKLFEKVRELAIYSTPKVFYRKISRGKRNYASLAVGQIFPDNIKNVQIFVFEYNGSYILYVIPR